MSFYTTNLQKDSITVVVYFLRNDDSSDNSSTDSNYTIHTDPVLSDDSQKELDYYSNITDDSNSNVDPDSLDSD